MMIKWDLENIYAAVFIIGAEIAKLFDERLKEKIAALHAKSENLPSIK